MSSSGSIPPPDHNSDDPFNVGDDQYLEEEGDAFRNLMKSQTDEQKKTQREARDQLKQNEEAKKSLVHRKAIKEEAEINEEKEGIEEEDAKKLNEKEELKESEETRLAAAKKGKDPKAVQMQEKKSNLSEDNTKITEKGEEKGLEKEDPLEIAKQQLKQEQQVTRTRGESVTPKEILDQERKPVSKAPKKLGEEKESEQKKTAKDPKKEATASPSKKVVQKNEMQSIAINLALGSTSLESTRAQKLDPSTSASEARKEMQAIVKKIIEEAEVLKKGDETKTIISLNMPDSIFDKGQITVTAHKYRPLEVNLKFQNFSKKGTQLIDENKKELKNLLKINSLTVHQLDVIH